ncbi:hypothetical protein [Mumia quercus]|uniref:hypothetical protein n=1 Tax=Mumia quercus TaxID=2976125 RepID=UPI0021CE2770|nr:hypothetical protein [Mumia quercus]
MSASTFRIGDGQPVAYETAKHLWAKSAREVLIEKAREYGGDLTDEELAAEVQRRTAVKTRVRTATWIDEVLAEVVAAAHAQGEPLLAALCVREDGRVLDGYPQTVARVTGTPVDDAERHAAEQRLACYQRFGAVLPAGGGRPAPSPRVRARASAPTRREPAVKKVERPVVVCPQCFMAVPATGVCDSCG